MFTCPYIYLKICKDLVKNKSYIAFNRCNATNLFIFSLYIKTDIFKYFIGNKEFKCVKYTIGSDIFIGV